MHLTISSKNLHDQLFKLSPNLQHWAETKKGTVKANEKNDMKKADSTQKQQFKLNPNVQEWLAGKKKDDQKRTGEPETGNEEKRTLLGAVKPPITNWIMLKELLSYNRGNNKKEKEFLLKFALF